MSQILKAQYNFPQGFRWGVATAAYQIEGGSNDEGRGRSIWDTFSHTTGKIVDGSNGDIACDSFHKYLEDVQMIKDIGVHFYRFSISWSRIIPEGTQPKLNSKGLEYYNKLIDALLKAGVEPMVTLYHWDLPQDIQNEGGWLNSKAIEYFKFYADTCFSNYGDRVKLWITFNEPQVFINGGLKLGKHAPGHCENPMQDPYTAAHNVLKAHAIAYRLYRSKYYSTQQGKVGITLDLGYAKPKTVAPKDREAAERKMQFDAGWFASPILGTGAYPLEMIKTISRRSTEQGLQKSRLPSNKFSEQYQLKDAADFLGINYYSSRIVEHNASVDLRDSDDSEVNTTIDDNWPIAGSEWLAVYPPGLQEVLKWVKERYGNPPVYITENGYSDRAVVLNDDDRISYLKEHLKYLSKAIQEDGCDVRGYALWSLMDNFEWDKGYTERFGIYSVDFDKPDRPRTAKASAAWYTSVIKSNKLTI